MKKRSILKNIAESVFIAFSIYSKIPVPGVYWNEDNKKYVMCAFPLVGVVIAFLMWVLNHILLALSAGSLIRGAAFTLLPVFVTGGIHMDGLMDTCDAYGSWGDRERKLAILKDSHVGAFAVIGLGAYLLWSAAVFGELPAERFTAVLPVFILSRACSGLSVVLLPSAREDGTVKIFHDSAAEQISAVIPGLWIFFGLILSVLAGRMCVIGLIAGLLLSVLYFLAVIVRSFGGITGDLAGFFLEISELFMVTGIWLATVFI